MSELHENLDLIGMPHEHPSKSAFSWGDGWWAQETKDGKVNLTLFGLAPREALQILRDSKGASK